MKVLIRIFTIALLSAPFVVSAEDTPKQGEPSKPAETTKPSDPSKTGDTSKPAKAAKLTSDELQVMAHYHELNLMEIDLGKAAMKSGTSEAIKKYGETLVEEHGNNNKQLMAIAKKTGQKIPKEKPASEAEKQEKAEAKAAAAKLKTLKGEDFDREYLRMMVQDHEKELAKADANLAKVKNAELADLLKATKPVLQGHADQARELQKAQVEARR